MTSVKRVRPSDRVGVRWGVYKLKKKAERIGYVQAPDAESAIERSMETLAIEESERWRISVQREG